MWKRLEEKLQGTCFEDVFMDSFWTEQDYVDGWALASVKFCQLLHGGSGGFKRGAARKAHWRALEVVRQRVVCIVEEWKPGLLWGPQQIKDDLLKRDIGYAGEEVGKVEKLSMSQILASLPPVGWGGSIRFVDGVSSSTRRLLENPSLTSLVEVEDHGQNVGRVRIQEGERMRVASLLVERGVFCNGTPKVKWHVRGCETRQGSWRS